MTLLWQNATRVPGTNCFPKYSLKIRAQCENPLPFSPHHREQTFPSLQSVGLVWIAFFTIFEGFLSCLCSQKCRIHEARRRKQEAAKQQTGSLSTHMI